MKVNTVKWMSFPRVSVFPESICRAVLCHDIGAAALHVGRNGSIGSIGSICSISSIGSIGGIGSIGSIGSIVQ